jgi:hypothetical protein
MDFSIKGTRTDTQPVVSGSGRGAVVVYPGEATRPGGHEIMTQCALARRLAGIKEYEYAGEYDRSLRYDGPLYFVPGDTLVDFRLARSLGIHGESDLFGGVVPFPFIATKTITHALPAANSPAPAGWSADFARAVQRAVLAGYSAYSRDDVLNAGLRLFKNGAVRLKKASGIGGSGQTVVEDEAELEAYVRALDAQELLRDGVVVEQNLTNVVTHSVGQVRVGNLKATYYGTQRLTVNNHGDEVYGGSRLVVMRGDFDALLRIELASDTRIAVEQAGTYHAAAIASFPGMFASRCNYDIAQGFGNDGQWHSGVLEQSWRIGGASGAEIAALEAFRADPSLEVVCASTTEVYGANPVVPQDAVIVYQGDDERTGRLTKYSRLEPYANS